MSSMKIQVHRCTEHVGSIEGSHCRVLVHNQQRRHLVQQIGSNFTFFGSKYLDSVFIIIALVYFYCVI